MNNAALLSGDRRGRRRRRTLSAPFVRINFFSLRSHRVCVQSLTFLAKTQVFFYSPCKYIYHLAIIIRAYNSIKKRKFLLVRLNWETTWAKEDKEAPLCRPPTTRYRDMHWAWFYIIFHWYPFHIVLFVLFMFFLLLLKLCFFFIFILCGVVVAVIARTDKRMRNKSSFFWFLAVCICCSPPVFVFNWNRGETCDNKYILTFIRTQLVSYFAAALMLRCTHRTTYIT